MGKAFKIEDFLPAAELERMAAQLRRFRPETDADALKLLRASFPDCSLSARVAALGYLMRRQPRASGAACLPD
ncbi:MAG: hypothetical protein ACK4UO_07100 [Pseudolabrys sp.]